MSPRRRGVGIGDALRAVLLKQAQTVGLRVALQAERVGDGGAYLQEVRARIAALESGQPAIVHGWALVSALLDVGPEHEARAARAARYVVEPDGEYRPAKEDDR